MQFFIAVLSVIELLKMVAWLAVDGFSSLLSVLRTGIDPQDQGFQMVAVALNSGALQHKNPLFSLGRWHFFDFKGQQEALG